uniref:G_PROTEIN_RECEP_F1_2 domain-containing protein n=1 Tax=Panagrellus redivivus TaxID=6233 RepID=A0A7E4W5Q5_PANRE
MMAFTDIIIGIGLLGRITVYLTGYPRTPEGYNRSICLSFAIPQIIGIMWNQSVLTHMAKDRLKAIRNPVHYANVSYTRESLKILFEWILSGTVVLLIIFLSLPSGYSVQCSTGSIASHGFLYAYVVTGVVKGIYVLTIYYRALKELKAKVRSAPKMAGVNVQSIVFKRVSVLLIFYLTFCVSPLLLVFISLQKTDMTYYYPDPDQLIELFVFRSIFAPICIAMHAFLIFVFIYSRSYRQSFHNWLTTMMAFADVIVGIGIFARISVFITGYPRTSDGYNRSICLAFAVPQFLGILWSQSIVSHMARDRLKAITNPTAYGNISFKIESMKIIIEWIIFGIIVLLVAYLTLPHSHSVQCSTGSIASHLFLYLYIFTGTVKGILVSCK